MNNLNNYISWLREKNFSPQTIQTYGKIISRYYGSLSLTTENIINFVKQKVKNLEPITCQTYLATLKSYAKFQKNIEIDWERINYLIPKIQKKFYTTINEQELEKLKQARFEESDRIYERNNLMLDFLFYAGLRVSELVNVKHQDWQNNCLRIHGKGNKVRYVFLPEFLVKCFKVNSPGYLFASTKGKKLSTRNISKVVYERTKLASFNKWVSPHTFRRSLATNLYNRGGKLETIQKQLGHANIQTTLGYIHNDFNTLYQDYSKIFQSEENGYLRNCATAELLAEINRRVGGGYA